jgi:hypothetical protein
MSIKFSTKMTYAEIYHDSELYSGELGYSACSTEYYAYYTWSATQMTITQVKARIKEILGTNFSYRVYISRDMRDGRRNVMIMVPNRHELAKAMLCGHTFRQCGHPEMYEEEKRLEEEEAA